MFEQKAKSLSKSIKVTKSFKLKMTITNYYSLLAIECQSACLLRKSSETAEPIDFDFFREDAKMVLG